MLLCTQVLASCGSCYCSVSLSSYGVFVLWNEKKPFFYGVIIFLCSYAGIGISVYPYLIPHQVTIWEAAAPDTTLKFILVGVVIMLPILLGYTTYAYYLFRGKSHGNYH